MPRLPRILIHNGVQPYLGTMMLKDTNQVGYANYAAFARAVYETGVLSDPWFDGCERFRMRGVVLPLRRARELAEAAERVAYVHQELVDVLFENPLLLTDFYHLTTCQQAMWEAAGSLWHGMARADLFVCEDNRITCCELNSDTPSGQPEAVLLNRLLHNSQSKGQGEVDDPNASMEARYVAMLRESHAKNTDQPLTTVGIIYPTELTEDLALITLLTHWLEAAGIRVVCGSPFNLRRASRGIEVLGVPVDLIVRHYKTDWWGERIPVWKDAPDYPDPEPLYNALGALLSAELNGEVTVVNPFGSVVTQNKLSLAFFWEEQERFSQRARAWIRKYIPETFRMTSVDLHQLRIEQDGWVIKSNYGCEGEETICGPFVSKDVWQKTLEQARAEQFIVQRFFQVKADESERLANYGVYLFGGSACGYFTRLSRQSTGYAAVTVPTFVARQGMGS
ncbi:MAG: glutathionylspermidine synthase family protein [Acidobacteriota bacterium]|nr:glutathionylspermidine synthase family protein [Acidobacteriota bacterium]